MPDVSNGVRLAASAISTDIAKMDAAASLEDKLRHAMRTARKEFDWMFDGTERHREEEQFKAAVGGVFITLDDDTKQRVDYELKLLAALSAIQTGLPVDIGSMIREDIQPVGLLKLWDEIKKEG